MTIETINGKHNLFIYIEKKHILFVRNTLSPKIRSLLVSRNNYSVNNYVFIHPSILIFVRKFSKGPY